MGPPAPKQEDLAQNVPLRRALSAAVIMGKKYNKTTYNKAQKLLSTQGV